jgi:Uma2 family endonuclease
MSTMEQARERVLPPLQAGQRLDRATFHARYEAMPPSTRAELIGGVVHMPSPLSRGHAGHELPVSNWLGHYERFTPGTWGAGNATLILGDWGEPQPDYLLLILPEFGGRSRVEGKYLAGAPELIVEIALSSREIDLGPKLRDYERAGVPEYLVVALEPDEIFWHIRREDRLVPMDPGPDGLYRSEVFPGLWLDPRALFARDWEGIFAALDLGLATPEHQAFVARLEEARRAP